MMVANRYHDVITWRTRTQHTVVAESGQISALGCDVILTLNLALCRVGCRGGDRGKWLPAQQGAPVDQ